MINVFFCVYVIWYQGSDYLKADSKMEIYIQEVLGVGAFRNNICDSQGMIEQREQMTGKQCKQRPQPVLQGVQELNGPSESPQIGVRGQAFYA